MDDRLLGCPCHLLHRFLYSATRIPLDVIYGNTRRLFQEKPPFFCPRDDRRLLFRGLTRNFLSLRTFSSFFRIFLHAVFPGLHYACPAAAPSRTESTPPYPYLCLSAPADFSPACCRKSGSPSGAPQTIDSLTGLNSEDCF